jgi:phosphohistidine swiveling domain-containing protein
MKLPSLQQTSSPEQLGHKAYRLGQLLKAGFPVPPGWVVPIDWPHPLRLPFTFNTAYAVRSSALGEDDERQSAAGKYRTILNVESRKDFEEAVQQVQASYAQEKGEKGAVLIQKMVEAQWSGVLFTRDPIEGLSFYILEGSPGIGGVVSGKETPQRLRIAHKEPAWPKDETSEAFLPKDVVQQLVNYAQRIENFFDGLPQDIEWAWDGTKLWILQTRPITNLVPVWTRKIASEVIPGAIRPLTWSINRPLTCGVWGELFTLVLQERAQGLDFEQTATLHRSHAYFNATLLGDIFRRMGLPEQGLAFLVRGEKFTRPPLKATVQNIPGLWQLIQKERKLEKQFKRDQRQQFTPLIRKLEKIRYEWMDPQELWQQILEIQVVLARATLYNILGPLGFALRNKLFAIPDSWLRSASDTLPEVASIRALTDLAKRARALLPSGMQQKAVLLTLEESPEGKALLVELEAWLHQYGYLSEVGTDIAVPTWREQPQTLYDLFATLVALEPVTTPQAQPDTPVDPLQLSIVRLEEAAIQVVKEDAEVQAVKKEKPRTKLDRWRLAQVAPRATLKGSIAEIYARLLAHLRWILVHLEERWVAQGLLAEAGDIFFLEVSEIRQLTQEPDPFDPKPIITLRRQQYDHDRQAQIPALVYGNILPEEVEAETLEAEEADGTKQLQGIPGSPGIKEGTVQIVTSLQGEYTINRETVLVVPYTDAGWSPLLVQAGALISEVGGQLSHGAIVAREYGLPAVMNIPGATQKFQNGQRVRVDGTKGGVFVIEEAVESVAQEVVEAAEPETAES